jgi:hypothetical protein
LIRGGALARKTAPVLKTPRGEPPGVLSVSPSSGSAAGGTTITITLDSYITSYGVVGVRVGGVAATSVAIVDRTTITAVTPAGTQGRLVPVKVTNHWGTGVKNAAYTYAATGDALLQENGDYLLQETGDRLLQE